MADNTQGLGADFDRMFAAHMATAGEKLAVEFVKQVESKTKAGSSSSGLLKQFGATAVAGSVTGAGASIAGATLGNPAGNNQDRRSSQKHPRK